MWILYGNRFCVVFYNLKMHVDPTSCSISKSRNSAVFVVFEHKSETFDINVVSWDFVAVFPESWSSSPSVSWVLIFVILDSCWMHVWPGGGTGPSSQLCVVFSSASSSRGQSSFVFLGSPCFMGLLNNVSKLNFPGSSRFTSSARSRLFPCGLTDASRGSWAHLSNGTHNHSLTQKDTQKMLSSESKFTQ